MANAAKLMVHSKTNGITPKKSRKKLSELSFTIVAWGLLILLLIGTIVPFYWMIVTSFKPQKELFSLSSPLLVLEPTWAHYGQLLQETLFGDWFFNSVFVSVVTTLISLILGSLAAYGVARIPSGVASSLARIILLVYLIPRAVLFIPLYQVLNFVGLLDSSFGLILAYLTFTLPFCIWLLIGYFKAIPKELDEAAMIDGASPLLALWRIIIPVARPGLVAASIFAFSMAWNEFMYPLAFIQSSIQQPLTVGVASLQQGDVFSWGQLMAAGTLAAIPLVIVYTLLQRHIVGGLVSGAVKG